MNHFAIHFGIWYYKTLTESLPSGAYSRAGVQDIKQVLTREVL